VINVPRKLAIVAGATATALLGLVAGPPAASAGSYVTIDGSGSSWSSVALDQWSQDLASSGITVNFTPDGSAAGRTDYIDGQDDFAASDPPFRNGGDKIANDGSELPIPYGYSYVPDTAGGTAFMYHLDVGGQQITNMRLTGQTIMKIFTGQITNWDNSEITHDYGKQLPSIPVIPVVRSDGSGATFFFTRWMSRVFPQQWDQFCSQVTHGRVSSGCGQTEFYPTSGWGNVQAENGSNNVATYVTSSYANGAIGYDEYAYALNSHYPVVAMSNPAGYYVLPTASNVAVALTQAQIVTDQHSPNFLQQNLDSVYSFTDPRSYPLSSYSYLIVPRSGQKLPNQFNSTPGAGKTLSTYIDYFLCAGQGQSAALGYSPIPLNLVQGGLLQASQIPGAVPEPNVNSSSSCPNPTFTNGQLTILKNAPYPTACQKVTSSLNCNTGGGGTKKTTTGSKTPSSGSPSTGPSGAVNPAGGSNTTGPGTSTGTGTAVSGQSVSLASNGVDQPVFGALTALAIVAAISLPPGVGFWLRRRRRRAIR
jgi:ABC-type phosphate transport system substrate-binding protein